MLIGILLPFAGTVLGSACVFFLKSLKKKIDKLLTGFAAGVMVQRLCGAFLFLRWNSPKIWGG